METLLQRVHATYPARTPSSSTGHPIVSLARTLARSSAFGRRAAIPVLHGIFALRHLASPFCLVLISPPRPHNPARVGPWESRRRWVRLAPRRRDCSLGNQGHGGRNQGPEEDADEGRDQSLRTCSSPVSLPRPRLRLPIRYRTFPLAVARDNPNVRGSQLVRLAEGPRVGQPLLTQTDSR
jgi:hypothetical protein